MGLLDATFAMLGSGLSRDTELIRKESPSGCWTALLMERERGVGMPIARHVRIRRKGWPLWQTVFVMQGKPEIDFHWASDTRLDVNPPDGRVFRRVDQVDEIAIVYPDLAGRNPISTTTP